MSRELGYEVWVLVAQIGVVLMAITIIVLEMIHIGQGNKNHVARAMILTFWMIHTIIYYGFVFLNQLHIIVIKDAIVFFTSWSATLRLHGYTSILLLSILRVARSKMWKDATKELFNGSAK